MSNFRWIGFDTPEAEAARFHAALERIRREQAWEDRRREERDETRKRTNERQAQLSEQAAILLNEMKRHSDILERALRDDPEITQDQVLSAFIYATSVVPEEDAALLGSPFAEIRRWIISGDDDSGEFSCSSGADKLDPNSFVTDILYREAVARQIKGEELIAAALTPWTPTEKDALALRYDSALAGLPSVGGPIHTSRAQFYFYFNANRKSLGLYQLDKVNWEQKLVHAFPTPSVIAEDLAEDGYVIKGRASTWWAIDQEGRFAVVGDILYSLADDKVERIGKLNITAAASVLEAKAPRQSISSWHVFQQLISISNEPVWIGRVEDDETKNCGVVCLRVLTGELLWARRLQSGDEWPSPPAGWHFVPTTGRLYFSASINITEAPAKQSFFERLTGKEPAKPEERIERRIVELDALSGREVRSVALPNSLSVTCSDGGNGRLAIGEQEYVEWYIDLETLAITDADERIPEALFGSIGELKLHVLRQFLKYRGGSIENDGTLGDSEVRLVRSECHSDTISFNVLDND